MNRKLVGAMFLIVASCGCRACENSCDYLPPVLDGPYSSHSVRSGSAGAAISGVPTPVLGEVITPLTGTE